MKLIRLAVPMVLFMLVHVQLSFAQQSFTKTSDGIVVTPTNTVLSGNTSNIRLQVITDKIIRVTAVAGKTFPTEESLITVYSPHPVNNWTAEAAGDSVVLKTAALKATISTISGAVSFTDLQGNALVSEKEMNGRQLSPAVFDGEPLYRVQQAFQTTPGDAWYGLGQHQTDQFNYKDKQVFLFQNNTEVAVPFLVSRKNYGILWDNYSLTTVGDTRPLMPLSTLKLFSKDGDQGWLTATYRNDINDANAKTFTRAESEINYPYLTDTKLHLPDSFAVAKGSVTWNGSISSGFSGSHLFRFTYAGYVKVYIDGKLMLDRWRQAWNPGSAEFTVNFQKNKKYDIAIEWIPDGGESYLTAKWMNPVADENKDQFAFDSEAGKAGDYYFVYGQNIDSVIAGYRYLTGKAPIMPKWAMGFWQSRERYKTQEEILTTIAEFRKRKIPIDNIVLDWSYWQQNQWGSQEFETSRFPDPEGMIKQLHDQYHAHLMISVWPKFYTGIPAYDEFNKKGWLYKRNVADEQRDWIAQGYVSTFYDAFNPAARKGFWDLIHSKLYTKGIDAWWMDASEPDILSNVSPEKRKLQMTPTALGSAALYLNAYPLENARGIYEGQRGADNNKRVFLLTRSGFAGSQRYAAAIWSGDIASRWSDMKAQISAGLNFSLSGLPYWTMDAGGFSVERRFENPNAADKKEWQELMTRWYQFGAFTPLFRVHGQYPYREIFNVADSSSEAYQSMLYYDKMRYRLLPYVYSLSGWAYHKDYTMMRGLVMDFTDTAVNNIGDQYMFGPALLINPVYTYGADSRQVYLPAGQGWYNLYSSEYLKGGQRVNASAPYGIMPVFVKEGSIIPTGLLCNTPPKNRQIPSPCLFIPAGTETLHCMKMATVPTNMKKARLPMFRFLIRKATKRSPSGSAKARSGA